MPHSIPRRESTLGLSAPLRAVVLLSRRMGSDDYPFASPEFRDRYFQKAFLAHAERLAVLGPILVELSRNDRLRELIPESGFDAGSHLRLLRRQAMMWDLERDFVLGRLARAGVPALLLKGAALRLTAYQDPAERAFGDLDILVSKPSVDAAVAALVDNGYEPESERRISLYLEHHHHLILSKPQGFVVEVHWALDAPISPFALDPSAFLRDARTLTTPHGLTLVPSPEHMVLHMAHQNLEDGFSHLRRLVDVDRVVTSAAGFDWARLASESKRMRVQGVVALSIRLAELLLATEVPVGFLDDLGLPGTTRAHLKLLDPVGLLVEQRGDRRAVRELVMLWCLPDHRTRLEALKEMLTGERTLWWRRLGPGIFRGGGDSGGTRLAALSKLAAYQAALYPVGLLGLGPRGRRLRAFWPKT